MEHALISIQQIQRQKRGVIKRGTSGKNLPTNGLESPPFKPKLTSCRNDFGVLENPHAVRRSRSKNNNFITHELLLFVGCEKEDFSRASLG